MTLVEWPERLGSGAARRGGSTSSSTGPATSRGRSRCGRSATASTATSRRSDERRPRSSRSTARRRASSSRSARATARSIDAIDWPAGYRHGETLLPAIDDLLGRTGTDRSRLAAVVVGTGPGAFTGLRVGLATAKGLAHGLGVPIVGVSTAEALLAGTPPGSVLLLPAGPSDRLLVRHGRPASLVPAGTEPDLEPDETVVAVDLADRAPADEVARGETARAGLAAALAGDRGGPPRGGRRRRPRPARARSTSRCRAGSASESGEVAWSHDRP